MADTLKKLAVSTDPIRLFYNGEMAKQIADEIGENGIFYNIIIKLFNLKIG